MLEDELRLGRAQHEVDRHQNGAHARQGEAKYGKRVRIAGDDRHAVAGANADGREPGGKAIAHVVELRVRPDGGAAADGHLLRETLPGPAEQVAQGLPAQR